VTHNRSDGHNIDETYSSVLINKSIVYEYFELIKNKDINGLLSLFTDDAIIYEPFSNISGGLQGKCTIKPFLEIAMMANNGLTHNIFIEKLSDDDNNNNTSKEYDDDNDNKNKVTALVTFERGDIVRARFTFELTPVLSEANNNSSLRKKIQILHIKFVG
jgi:hypothetical protein